jgi:hypothetical protein
MKQGVKSTEFIAFGVISRFETVRVELGEQQLDVILKTE